MLFFGSDSNITTNQKYNTSKQNMRHKKGKWESSGEDGDVHVPSIKCATLINKNMTVDKIGIIERPQCWHMKVDQH